MYEITDWNIMCITGIGEEDIPFAHTDGLESFGHPEVYITLPLPQEVYTNILNQIGIKIKHYKKRYTVDGDYEDIFEKGFAALILYPYYTCLVSFLYLYCFYIVSILF